MIIVTTADPFWQQHDDQSWKHESAVIEMVGKFINSLPSEWRAGQSDVPAGWQLVQD